jgi:hypothetical protein
VFKRKSESLKSRKQGRTFFLVVVLLLAVFLFCYGCAGKYPATLSLDAGQEKSARLLLQKIRKQGQPSSIDADVSVSWKGYGQKYTFNATLLATRDGRFRLSGLGPLGRPFFILVTDGAAFTLVDNRQGRAYDGSVDSEYFRKYIPTGVQLSTCFSLLTAQISAQKLQEIRVAENMESYWFVFTGMHGLARRIEVDPDTGSLVRQILVDAKNEIIVDVRYDGHQVQAESLHLPKHLHMESEKMVGSLEITLNRIYREKPFPDTVFDLRIPDYFSIVHVK